MLQAKNDHPKTWHVYHLEKFRIPDHQLFLEPGFQEAEISACASISSEQDVFSNTKRQDKQKGTYNVYFTKPK